MNVAQLNSQFGISNQLSFRTDDSGLIIADINNGQASLCLQGAHLMHWQPASQSVPVVWLSRDTKPAVGKSIRGGAPVCWPWFGAHASEAGFPGHGFARTVPWQVIESGTEPNGATRLVLRLIESEKTRTQWNQSCTVDLTVVVGETLRMELTTANTGTTDFVIGEALHTYLHISDIAAVSVTGLEGCDYWDKVGGSNLRQQAGAIQFSGETDRVYINTAAECVIEDPKLNRRIHVAKSGSLSTVVWTPWVEKANKMGDMGQPDGWREMVCVESANAIENVVTVAAGTQHRLVVEYRASTM
ncbi:MAG: D-hexose-6-phosphate mutarotase [Gallionella sp.]|nr:D-hexose-6-phosphate mutarotase [Gallionella sp.]MDD4959726.1 D-hexose-6-phosphate mutarotase [Gallionella sp.]